MTLITLRGNSVLLEDKSMPNQSWLLVGSSAAEQLWSSTESISANTESFWNRNKIQVFIHKNAPAIGSAYGNQPYRSFREKSVPPRRDCYCARRQRACQRGHQHACNLFPIHLIYRGDLVVLLRRRPGRRRTLAVCFNNDYTQGVLTSVGRLGNERGGL